MLGGRLEGRPGQKPCSPSSRTTCMVGVLVVCPPPQAHCPALVPPSSPACCLNLHCGPATHPRPEVLRIFCPKQSPPSLLPTNPRRPGAYEFTLESHYLHSIYAGGGCRTAHYTPIFASGPNGAVLHYGHAGAPNGACKAGSGGRSPLGVGWGQGARVGGLPATRVLCGRQPSRKPCQAVRLFCSSSLEVICQHRGSCCRFADWPELTVVGGCWLSLHSRSFLAVVADRQLQEGELLLVDAGGEYYRYAGQQPSARQVLEL